MFRLRRLAPLALLLTVPLALAACSGSGSGSSSASGGGSITTVRLGYFPNLTHAPALVGTQQGTFKAALKDLKITVTPTVFNAGPDAVTALFADSLDCTYIGPNPTVNAYVQSKGAAIRVVAGSTSGGASLVVRPEINSVADMKGKSFATPQLGNTQDVAFRSWLKGQAVETTPEGGGDVSIKPQSNAEGLAAYVSGSIDGAWVPEPWVSEYVAKGAKVLVDEKSLWEGGKFVTTQIICRTAFIAEHPDVVKALIEGHIAALDLIKADPTAAKESVTLALTGLTGTAPSKEILDAAWKQVDFTVDPLKATLVKSAEEAAAVGLLDQAGVDAAGGLPGNLYDLKILNEVLAGAGQPAVA
ncbi:MAG: ABC transporter substrate-binding protein [Actinobacteria bacterium]|nr:ABC transporter substrate-binding protein [Actinomycetota bacterium]